MLCYSTAVSDLAAVFVPRSRPVRRISPFRLLVRLVRPPITRWVEVLVRVVNLCRNVPRLPVAFSIPIGLCVRWWLCGRPLVGNRRLIENAICKHGDRCLINLGFNILGRTRVFMAVTVVPANIRVRLG